MSGQRKFLGIVVGLALAASCSAADESPADQPRHLGQEIVITGSVQRTIDPTGFLLSSDAHAGGLLIVAPGQPAHASDVVEVTGVVLRFERRSVEAEVGRTLDHERYGKFEGVDYVKADRVTVRS